MYATLDLIKTSKRSGRLVGVHQKIDRLARRQISPYLRKPNVFPSIKEILYFEGTNGPDGIKRKSPNEDEPHSFIDPDHDDKKLFTQIVNHHHKLSLALKNSDREQSAFEAAWLAHFVVDGLTPAHHYPFEQKVEALMSDKDYVKLFGQKIKGIMRGRNLSEAIKNNWQYLGIGGVMTRHIAYEMGVAYAIGPVSGTKILARCQKPPLPPRAPGEVFYSYLDYIHAMRIYDRFLESGWTVELIEENNKILIPQIISCLSEIWLSALPDTARKARHE